MQSIIFFLIYLFKLTVDGLDLALSVINSFRYHIDDIIFLFSLVFFSGSFVHMMSSLFLGMRVFALPLYIRVCVCLWFRRDVSLLFSLFLCPSSSFPFFPLRTVIFDETNEDLPVNRSSFFSASKSIILTDQSIYTKSIDNCIKISYILNNNPIVKVHIFVRETFETFSTDIFSFSTLKQFSISRFWMWMTFNRDDDRVRNCLIIVVY